MFYILSQKSSSISSAEWDQTWGASTRWRNRTQPSQFWGSKVFIGVFQTLFLSIRRFSQLPGSILQRLKGPGSAPEQHLSVSRVSNQRMTFPAHSVAMTVMECVAERAFPHTEQTVSSWLRSRQKWIRFGVLLWCPAVHKLPLSSLGVWVSDHMLGLSVHAAWPHSLWPAGITEFLFLGFPLQMKLAIFRQDICALTVWLFCFWGNNGSFLWFRLWTVWSRLLQRSLLSVFVEQHPWLHALHSGKTITCWRTIFLFCRTFSNKTLCL